MPVRNYWIWHSPMTGGVQRLTHNVHVLWYSAMMDSLSLLCGWAPVTTLVHRCIQWSCWTKYLLDDGSDDRIINQMRTQDIWCKCTLRGTLAKPLPKRESWSSRLVLTQSTSAQRLLATHKIGGFYSQEMLGDRMWGTYDIICAAIWWWSSHFGGKHS